MTHSIYREHLSEVGIVRCCPIKSLKLWMILSSKKIDKMQETNSKLIVSTNYRFCKFFFFFLNKIQRQICTDLCKPYSLVPLSICLQISTCVHSFVDQTQKLDALWNIRTSQLFNKHVLGQWYEELRMITWDAITLYKLCNPWLPYNISHHKNDF